MGGTGFEIYCSADDHGKNNVYFKITKSKFQKSHLKKRMGRRDDICIFSENL